MQSALAMVESSRASSGASFGSFQSYGLGITVRNHFLFGNNATYKHYYDSQIVLSLSETMHT